METKAFNVQTLKAATFCIKPIINLQNMNIQNKIKIKPSRKISKYFCTYTVFQQSETKFRRETIKLTELKYGSVNSIPALEKNLVSNLKPTF